MPTPQLYIIHDNAEWIAPLHKALNAAAVPHTDWNLADPTFVTRLDFSRPPPSGVFFNRVSPSAHTRGLPHAMDHAASVVSWLEAFGRRVLGGSGALSAEMSKVVGMAALERAGVRQPAFATVVGRTPAAIDDALSTLPEGRLVVKPNRGGSGSGVRIVGGAKQARDFILSPEFVEGASVDDITIIQEYIAPPEGDDCLYRLEFVAGQLLYGVRVDTSAIVEGAVANNCPADSCDLKRRRAESKKAAEAAINESATGVEVASACPLKARGSKFKVLPDFDDEQVAPLKAAIDLCGSDVCGIEIVRSAAGVSYVIDFNAINTNYNHRAERRAKIGLRFGAGRVSGNQAIAALVKKELESRYPGSVTPQAASDEVGAAAGSGAGASSARDSKVEEAPTSAAPTAASLRLVAGAAPREVARPVASAAAVAAAPVAVTTE